ncbi:hypothetical protein [Salinigranum rubrum]|nr:hypothetical protein [Salinigranum rubrum]
MIQSTLRVRLPDGLWIGEVSRSVPAATFELLAGIDAAPRAVELGQVHAADPAAILDTIDSHDAIGDLEVQDWIPDIVS